MVAGCSERFWHSSKYTLTVVMDLRSFPVQKFGCPIHCCAVSRSDRLVAEAHTEDRDLPCALADDAHADPGILWGARSWGEQNSVVGAHLFDGDLVIAFHRDLSTKLSEVLDDVEDERVVVVDDEDADHTPYCGPTSLAGLTQSGLRASAAEDHVPESKGRKKDPYIPPPTSKGERKAARIGSAPWLAPAMVTCFVIGLAYIVVFYIAGNQIPIMNSIGGSLNALVNVGIGFSFIIVGFILSTKWK